MPTSVNAGQREADQCHFCKEPIVLLRDGYAFVNGYRTCIPCTRPKKIDKKQPAQRDWTYRPMW